MSEAIGRLISLTLRIPSPMAPQLRLQAIASQLRGIGGSRAIGFGPKQIRSVPDAIGLVLFDHLNSTESERVEKKTEEVVLAQTHSGNFCPECSSLTLVYEEGCKKCTSCGYSEC
jgi:ribonucleoside-diphosphate reductase alpha chain